MNDRSYHYPFNLGGRFEIDYVSGKELNVQDGVEKILSLVGRVLQNELPLEHAIESLTADQFKPYLSDELIRDLARGLEQPMLRFRPETYVLAVLCYEASKITANLRLQAYCGFTLGLILLDLGRFIESIPLFRRTLAISREIGHRQGEETSLVNLGLAYSSLEDYAKGIDYFQQALKISREIRDPKVEGNSLANLGVAYCSLGNHSKGIYYHQRALKIARQTGDRKAEANSHNNLGAVFFSLGDYPRAIESSQEASELSRKIGYRKGEGYALGNLGEVYRCLGDYPKAMKYSQEALTICREIGDRKGEGNALNNLANTHFSLGHYSKTIEYSQQVLKISREMRNREGEGNSLVNLGAAYLSLGDYPKAIESSQEALEISREIGYRKGEGYALGNLSEAYRSLRNYNKAIECNQQALTISTEIGDRKGEQERLGSLGIVFSSLGDFPRAIQYYQQALKISREIGDRHGEGITLANIGGVYSSLGDCPKTIQHFKQALEIAREIGTIDAERLSLANLGRAHDHGLKQNDIAYRYYKQSIELTEKMRGGIKQEEHRSSFFRESERVYDAMILLCNRMKSKQKEKLEESFEYLERSKSRTFLESLAHTSLKPPEKIPTELIQRESELLQEIRVMYLKKERQQSVTMAEIENLESKLDQVWNKIGKIDPEYVSIRRGKPLTFPHIRSLIKSQGEKFCVVEYFLTKDRLLIFILRSEDTELKTYEVVISSEKLRYYADKYSDELHYLGERDIGQIWQNLSRYLIQPILEYLDGIDTIYFVPHRVIHYLPLHVLRHNGKYLIEKYKIVYCPSASVISYCQKKRRGKRQSCLSLGVTFEKEADRVAQIFKDGSSVFKGSQVTKNLIEKESKEKDIIHFSCHGFFHPQLPMKSGLLLADDELLTVEDILQLRLNADLVTLSACQTGINEQKPGDDLVGLTRSFIYAGTPSVVVSLWSVSADSTIELMERFYTYLKEGKTKVQALQKAQLDIMKNPKYSHPYYWAPFILVGDWK